jgi:hypothetical protein
VLHKLSSASVCVAISLAAGAGVSAPALAAGRAQAREEEPRALAVTFSDGQVHRRLIHGPGGSWTPKFPRRPNPPDQQGLKLAALQFDHAPKGDSVSVSVSLRYGSPTQKIVPVATVTVGTVPVVVNELEAFGVDPITLTVVPVAVVPPVLPAVSSASSKLNASIEPLSQVVPQFAVVLRNEADRAVMAVSVRFYADGKEMGKGRFKTNLDTPLIAPGATYRRTIVVSNSDAAPPGGEWVPRSFDRLEIAGVLWDDGLVEGDPALGPSEAALSAGRARQLDVAIETLKRALAAEPPLDAATLRASIERMHVAGGSPGTEMQGMLQVKDTLLKELAALDSAAGSQALQTWIAEAITRCSAWRRRIK